MKQIIFFLLFTSIALSVELSIPTDGGTLKATLEMPPNPNGKAVLIISGSGPTDRDGNSAMLGGDNNSLKMLAETLRDEGIASIRFDKRMIGGSNDFELNESKLSFSDFVNDAKAVFQKLDEEGFDKFYVIGHSEGSLIGTLVSQKEDIDGFVSLCGLGKPIGETIINQFADRAPGLVDTVASYVDKFKNDEKINYVNPMLFSVFRPSIHKFMREYIQYDPSDELSKLKVPKLIINGAHDFQVKEADGRYLLAKSPKAKYVLLDSMNHVLKNTPNDYTQQIASYTDPKLPLNQELIKEIVGFILEN